MTNQEELEAYIQELRQRLSLAEKVYEANGYRMPIPKTETTSCEWCGSGIDAASVMGTDMMMRFVRPVNYCPNCGRRLEG